MADKIEHKVKDFINKYKMVNSQDRIVVGVSGGADSVCLLFALKNLMNELKVTLIVAHVNHGLRGEFACRDEKFVKELSAKLGLPCYTTKVDTAKVAKREKLSIEEAGRTLRRDFFQKVKAKTGSNKIALAHHINDNVETLLMNLSRGSGLRGVSGMKPINGDYIRPLLCLTKGEVEEELNNKGIPFCIDETNEDNGYARNRVRNKVIPYLEKVNSKAVLHMNDVMIHLREVEEFIEKKVMEELCQAVEKQDTSVIINNKITTLPIVIQKEMIKRVVEEISEKRQNFSGIHIKQIQELFSQQVGRRLNLPYRLVVSREYQGVRIQQKSEKGTSREGIGDIKKKVNRGEKAKEKIVIKVPGTTKIPAFNLTIECRFIPEEEKNSYEPSYSLYTKSIDYDIMKSGLSLRSRESGDRITIDKKGSRQKLKSLFINEKVPSEERDNIPLLVDGNEVVWIIGYRMNKKYQIDSNTKTIVEIKVHKEEC